MGLAVDMHLQPGDVLLLVDVQNDFLPGGSLGVPRGDEVIAPLNRAIGLFMARSRPVFASRDWHPVRPLLVPGAGRAVAAALRRRFPGRGFRARPRAARPSAVMVFKATRADEETSIPCSAARASKACCAPAGAQRIVIGGLATDYCVLATTRDARPARLCGRGAHRPRCARSTCRPGTAPVRWRKWPRLGAVPWPYRTNLQ